MNARRARPRPTIAALLLAAAVAAPAAWGTGPAGARPTQEGASARTQEGPGTNRAEARSAVYGRAVHEATGRPLRRARIMLMSLEGGRGARVERAGLADARGEFRIGDLEAGAYVLWADVSGMLTPVAFAEVIADAPTDPETLRRHFDVIELDGKTEREVTLRARRGGAVTGRVTYADGEPAVGLSVHLLRRTDGRLSQVPARALGAASGQLRTDDRGVYRAAGVPPGEYLVAVYESADHTGGPTDPDSPLDLPGASDLFFGRQLLTTYHPSATSRKAAEAVSVRAGEEHADVDIVVADRALRSVAGVVRGARGGAPVRGARVYLVPHEGAGRTIVDTILFELEGAAVTDAEGRWRLRDLPDGLYTLVVKPPDEEERRGGVQSENRNAAPATNTRPARRPRRYAPLRRELRLTADVDELLVELNEGARVAGTIVVEGGKAGPHDYVYVHALRAAPSFTEAIGERVSGTVVRDGSFELEGLPPGKYFLHPREYPSGGPYLKAVTWQGRDLLREPLEVGEGTQIEGVRVVYGGDPAVLVVRVFIEGKTPAYNVNVFLLPAGAADWSLFAPQPYCSTSNVGLCRVSAAPGDYLVVATPSIEQTADPEQELRRRAAKAPRVTLRANEEKALDTFMVK